MKNFLMRQVLGPMFARLGTLAAGVLVGTLAVEPETANQVAMGIGAAGAVVLDLITRKWGER